MRRPRLPLLVVAAVVVVSAAALATVTYAQRIHVSQVAALTECQRIWGRTFANWNGGLCLNAPYLRCDALGYVTSMSITDVPLNGGIPSVISTLARLSVLRLSGNGLSGNIPSTVGNLLLLQSMILSNNRFNGLIPPTVSKLSQLRFLNVASNALTGGLPTVLSTLRLLTAFLAQDNYLQGGIPLAMATLPALQVLNLHNNSLIGGLPASISSLLNLVNLDLSDNELEGPYPSVVSRLPKLSSINLRGNAFSGILPVTTSAVQLTTPPLNIGNSSVLAMLDISGNRFSGDIPDGISRFTTLSMLCLENNQFSGSLSSALSTLTRLTSLKLGRNNFRGLLPPGLGSLVALRELDISLNGLTGAIPPSFTGLTSLSAFVAFNNLFTMDTLMGMARLRNLRKLDLNSNTIAGAIPPSIGSILALDYLELSMNELNGSIPTFLTLLTKLSVLGLASNNLVGTIPSGIESLRNLARLYLSGNGIEGSIPATIAKLTQLSMLILQANQLTGTIPSEVGLMTSLRYVDLSQNLLSGVVPGNLGGLTDLQRLDLAGSYSMLRCPDPGSLCLMTSKPSNRSIYCRQNCPRFCGNCTVGLPNTTESRGFATALTQKQGRLNPNFRYASLLNDTNRPLTKDWRLDGYVFSVKDQGPCASCWAFAATAAVESAIAIGLGRQVVSLSEQQVLDCQSDERFGCEGGLPGTALDYIANTTVELTSAGILPADFYPYKGTKTSQCEVINQPLLPTPTGVTMYEQINFYGWFGILLAVQWQPVIANLVGSHPTFQNYKGVEDVYADLECASGLVDHSVVIVGYNIESKPPYWIIRNSAGSSWGRGGYMNMRIDEGDGICNIHSTPAMYPVITPPSPCSSPLQPCGLGSCVPDENKGAPRTGFNGCICPPGYINVTNIDGTSTSCALLDACNYYTFNPCGVGQCVNDNLGGYVCICPLGYQDGFLALDNSDTCVPAMSTPGQAIQLEVKLPGYTCTAVAAAYGLSIQNLLQQNPQLSEPQCGDIPQGLHLNVTASSLVANCTARYSWSRGDTCETVAQLVNVTVEYLQLLNPSLNCTSASDHPSLGQQLCINTREAEDDLAPEPQCMDYKMVNATDTCASIIARSAIDAQTFFGLNPGLFCDSIGQTSIVDRSLPPVDKVCVSGELLGRGVCPPNHNSYRVKNGDTCLSLLASKFGNSQPRFKAANWGTPCFGNLYVNKLICVACTVCARSPPPIGKV